MAALFVSYTAKSERGNLATGWISLLNRSEPQNTEEIKSLCKIISERENLKNVIPLWWKSLDS